MPRFSQVDWLAGEIAVDPLASWAVNVPSDLHLSVFDDDFVRWAFRAAIGPRSAELQAACGRAWPAIYCDLVDRFRFAAFELGPILFHSNLGVGWDDDVVFLLSQDPHLAPPMIAAGFLPFGRPATGSYDRVCFDMRGGGGGDAPIVVLDHEQAFQWDKAKVIETIVPGLGAFLDQARNKGLKPAGDD